MNYVRKKFYSPGPGFQHDLLSPKKQTSFCSNISAKSKFLSQVQNWKIKMISGPQLQDFLQRQLKL